MKELLSISLSFLILFSQLGLSYAKHYCGNKAVGFEVTLGTSNLNCGIEDGSKTCSEHSSQSTISKKSCCKNTSISLSLTDTVGDSIFQWYSLLQFVPISSGNTYQTAYLKESGKWVITEAPPDIRQPIRALYQVFII